MKELRLSFNNLQKFFILKHPNGKIEKENGIIKVWFNKQHKNIYYKYNGTILDIAEKLDINIENNYTIYTPITTVNTASRKTGTIEVLADDMGYHASTPLIQVEYIIENGKITLSYGRRNKNLKIYQTKKGYHFNLNSKRYSILN